MQTLAFDDLLTPTQLTERFPVFSVGHWAQMRCRGDGPTYLRVNGRILCRPADVSAWLETHVTRSTAETKKAREAKRAALAAG